MTKQLYTLQESSLMWNITIIDFPGGSEVKASAYNAGDLGSIPELGRSPGEGLFLSKLDKNNPGYYQYQFIPLLVYVEKKWLNILSFEYKFTFSPQNINLLYILDYTDLLWVPLFQFISCLNDEWHLEQYRAMLVLVDSNS